MSAEKNIMGVVCLLIKKIWKRTWLGTVAFHLMCNTFIYSLKVKLPFKPHFQHGLSKA